MKAGRIRGKEDFYRRERKNGHRSIFFPPSLSLFLSFIVYIIVN